jgi:hypothetical protein
LSIAQDPIVGNGQKSTSFWEQVISNFNLKKNEVIRNGKSLETKWDVTKA